MPDTKHLPQPDPERVARAIWATEYTVEPLIRRGTIETVEAAEDLILLRDAARLWLAEHHPTGRRARRSPPGHGGPGDPPHTDDSDDPS